MFNLSSFLEKFKNLKDPKEDKTRISCIISDVIGVKLSEKDLTIQKGTLFIQGSALYKNQIFINKDLILNKINAELPQLYLKEII